MIESSELVVPLHLGFRVMDAFVGKANWGLWSHYLNALDVPLSKCLEQQRTYRVRKHTVSWILDQLEKLTCRSKWVGHPNPNPTPFSTSVNVTLNEAHNTAPNFSHREKEAMTVGLFLKSVKQTNLCIWAAVINIQMSLILASGQALIKTSKTIKGMISGDAWKWRM